MNAESSDKLVPVSRSWRVMEARDRAVPDKPGGSVALALVVVAIAAFYWVFVGC